MKTTKRTLQLIIASSLLAASTQAMLLEDAKKAVNQYSLACNVNDELVHNALSDLENAAQGSPAVPDQKANDIINNMMAQHSRQFKQAVQQEKTDIMQATAASLVNKSPVQPQQNSVDENAVDNDAAFAEILAKLKLEAEEQEAAEKAQEQAELEKALRMSQLEAKNQARITKMYEEQEKVQQASSANNGAPAPAVGRSQQQTKPNVTPVSFGKKENTPSASALAALKRQEEAAYQKQLAQQEEELARCNNLKKSGNTSVPAPVVAQPKTNAPAPAVARPKKLVRFNNLKKIGNTSAPAPVVAQPKTNAPAPVLSRANDDDEEINNAPGGVVAARPKAAPAPTSTNERKKKTPKEKLVDNSHILPGVDTPTPGNPALEADRAILADIIRQIIQSDDYAELFVEFIKLLNKQNKQDAKLATKLFALAMKKQAEDQAIANAPAPVAAPSIPAAPALPPVALHEAKAPAAPASKVAKSAAQPSQSVVRPNAPDASVLQGERKSLKKVDQDAAHPSSGPVVERPLNARGALMKAIQGGAQLKQVDPNAPHSASKEKPAPTGLAASLKEQLDKRRGALKEDSDLNSNKEDSDLNSNEENWDEN